MSADTTTKQFKKQLPRNLIMKAVSFSTSVLVGLWLVPYLIDHLGVAAFGMVPLAAVFTQYVSVISHALTTPVLRFLTIEVKKEDGDPAGVFTTALCLFVLVAALQIPAILYGVLNLDVIFRVPENLMRDAQILFVCSGLAYLLGFIGAAFGVSFYSNNRLDIEEALRTFQYVLRFFLIAGLFWGGGATLRYVGYADLVVALYLFVSRVYFWKRLSPELAIRASSVDLDRLWPILRMSVWVLVNYLGVVLFLRTNIWVANKFISEAAGGEYGALLLIDRLIRSGTTIVTFVISPMIMIYYSKGELARANKVAQLAEKLMMGLVAVICALICAYSPHLLSLWLGAEFVYLWPVVVALVSHLFLNSGCSSLFHLHNAYNKVKVPAIVTVVLGLINAVMGIYLTSMHGMGLLGVAIVTSVLLTVKNVVFIPAFTSIVTNESVGYYLKPMMSGFGVFFCVASVSMLSYVVGVESNLVFQAALGIFAAVVGLFVFFRVFLSSSEFNLLLEILPKRARAVVLCFPLRKN